MTSYAYAKTCRRAFLLAYFGDRRSACSGCDVCSGPREPAASEELLERPAPRRTRDERGARREPPAAADDADPLVTRLRAVRTALAKEAGVPPYVIFPDATLVELAERRPADERQLLQVHGMGAKRVARYGEQVLRAIAGR
jgi:ATP-dependent DNA helicase RecQ